MSFDGRPWFRTWRAPVAGVGTVAVVAVAFGFWAVIERGMGAGYSSRSMAVGSRAVPDASAAASNPPFPLVAPSSGRGSGSASSAVPSRPSAAPVAGPAVWATSAYPEAIVRIPALGPAWSRPVFAGSGVDQLRRGLGHIPTTASPGQIGNYVLAGHRSGVPDPALRRIDDVAVGALIVVEAGRRGWTYRVDGREVIDPTDTDVLAAVPRHPERAPTRSVLTLITCWPADGHSKRFAVYATLVGVKR